MAKKKKVTAKEKYEKRQKRRIKKQIAVNEEKKRIHGILFRQFEKIPPKEFFVYQETTERKKRDLVNEFDWKAYRWFSNLGYTQRRFIEKGRKILYRNFGYNRPSVCKCETCRCVKEKK